MLLKVAKIQMFIKGLLRKCKYNYVNVFDVALFVFSVSIFLRNTKKLYLGYILIHFPMILNICRSGLHYGVNLVLLSS